MDAVRRVAKGVGQKVSAALGSLKVGWGGGAAERSPSTPVTPVAVASEHAGLPARRSEPESAAKAPRVSVAAGGSSPQRAAAHLKSQQGSAGSSPHPIESAADFAAHASQSAAVSRTDCGGNDHQQLPQSTGRSSFEDDASRMEALGGDTGGGPKRPEMLYPAGPELLICYQSTTYLCRISPSLPPAHIMLHQNLHQN